MPKAVLRGNIASSSMLRSLTTVDNYVREYGLYVKREDLACLPPGPPFSKARGVFARVASRPEKVIGVLDTFHSQAGWAVARACELLGKVCINYYPAYKQIPGPHAAQLKARARGANLHALPAGRSAILFHAARKHCESKDGYMMPNALKLEESVTETAKEVANTLKYKPNQVLIPISSGTIAAGVIRGFAKADQHPMYLIHLGYSRSHDEVKRYIQAASGCSDINLEIIDEGYAYKDIARDGETPPWPCNEYYDLKCFRWWLDHRSGYNGRTLMWNIG
jgi:hypothetical protein